MLATQAVLDIHAATTTTTTNMRADMRRETGVGTDWSPRRQGEVDKQHR